MEISLAPPRGKVINRETAKRQNRAGITARTRPKFENDDTGEPNSRNVRRFRTARAPFATDTYRTEM